MRGVIAFLLLFSLSAQGQMVIDSYRFGAAAAPLLDDYPNAEGAYSLRLLRTAYTGDAIMVRRSSDNDSLAIGFSGGVLDTAAMKTFCGTGATDTCFVRRWYDQSGNNKDAQESTSSSQPIILIDGNAVYENGQLAIDFTSTARGLLIPNQIAVNVNKFFLFSTVKSRTAASEGVILNAFIGTGTSARILFTINSAGNLSAGGRRLDADAFQSVNNSNTASRQIIATAFYDYANANLYIYENGTQIQRTGGFQTAGSTSNTNNFTAPSIGARFISPNYTLALDGLIQELIIYNSDQSTNRAAIETNINNFYQIY